MQPFAERDRLATLLAPDRGKIRAVARGAQRGRGPLAGVVQPFVRARLLLWEGRSLDGISQAEVLARPSHLDRDLRRFAAACYLCELADGLSAERSEASGLYARLLQGLWLVDAPEAVPEPEVALCWADLALLTAAGFGPELGRCAGCGAPVGSGEPARFAAAAGGLLCRACGAGEAGGVVVSGSAVRALRFLAQADARQVPRVRMGPRTLAEVRAALGTHVDAVLGRPLRSRGLLEALPRGEAIPAAAPQAGAPARPADRGAVDG